MRAKILMMIMVAIIAVCTFVACNKTDDERSAFEEQVIALALRDLDTSAESVELILLSTEDVPWLDCEVSDYLMIADGKAYLVGVQHNGDEIEYVDVEGEIGE